jgi:AmmeMemoRadiSam system protein A
MKLWVVGIGITVLGVLFFAGLREVTMERVGPIELTDDERLFLLDLARRTLEAHLSGDPAPQVEEVDPGDALRAEASCFVTLSKNESLRGCILDSFVPHEAVYANVMRNVVLAAANDPRFPPVTADELPEIRIEISVLGRPYAIGFENPEELVSSLRPGIDGVILTTGYGSSTYLPQVWEQLPDPEEFLTELCRKHGAPGDAWRSGDLMRVEVYQVNHFGEASPGHDVSLSD